MSDLAATLVAVFVGLLAGAGAILALVALAVWLGV